MLIILTDLTSMFGLCAEPGLLLEIKLVKRKRSPESVLALSCTKVEDYPHELQHRAAN